MSRGVALGFFVVAITGVTGCGGDSSSTSGNVWNQPESQYVIDALDLPFTQSDATSLASDLDGDGVVDNRLGEILLALVSYFPPNHQAEMATIMASGRIVHLLSIYAATPQTSSEAAVWEFIGQPLANPATPAAGLPFAVDTTLGLNDLIAHGSVEAGSAAFGDETTTLAVNLPLTSGASVILPVYLAQLEYTLIAAGTLEGRLVGAVLQSDVESKVIAAVNSAMAQKCEPTNGCTCEADSGAAVMQDLLDTDDNCTVTLAEAQANAVLQQVLAGDLTMSDGSKALSIGLGFRAVPVTFTHAAPPQ